MVARICLDGREIAGDIRKQCRRMKRSIKSVCIEAKVSYRTYTSWQQGRNPSFPMLKRIYSVLGGGDNG
jgi:hypothetical protein